MKWYLLEFNRSIVLNEKTHGMSTTPMCIREKILKRFLTTMCPLNVNCKGVPIGEDYD